jgi:hypothetical protein
MKTYLVYIMFALVSVASNTLHAQAIDQLGIKKGADLSGSLSATTNSYKAFGIPNRRDPFNWFLNGNFNFTLFGYSMPFSFSYSNQNRNFTQPFNRFQFAPSYKWAKVNIGTQSMNFSNYTLAGHMFNGVGTELTPGKFSISAMYGTLLKAVPFATLTTNSTREDSLQNNRGAFQRKGAGVKLGFNNNGNSYGISVFKAQDIVNSLPFVPVDANLTPRDNISMGITLKQNMGKHFFSELEYSLSSINKDNRLNSNFEDSVKQQNLGKYNLLNGFLKPNGSKVFYDALQAGVGFTMNHFSVKLNYERVAPDYETMGAYNVISDIQNMTIAPSVQLLKGKVNIAANVGLQNDNLNKQKATTSKRVVGNGSVSITPNNHWNINANYNNFTSFIRTKPLDNPFTVRTPYDSLDFYQVNKSYGGAVAYIFGSKEIPKNISLNVNYQQAADEQRGADINQIINTDFFTSNLGFTLSKSKVGLSVTTGVNYYINNNPSGSTSFIGPSLSVSKTMMQQKLRLSSNATYSFTNSNFNNVVSKSSITNASVQASLALGKKASTQANSANGGVSNESASQSSLSKKKKGRHAMNGSLNFVNQPAMLNRPGYSEFVLNVGYTFSF